MDQTKTYTVESAETDVMINNDRGCQLIVWNDEVNSFDWVITTLVEVCGHTVEQAEQCAILLLKEELVQPSKNFQSVNNVNGYP